jgi:hypothetical protein
MMLQAMLLQVESSCQLKQANYPQSVSQHLNLNKLWTARSI